jgi:hypothetical protein
MAPDKVLISVPEIVSLQKPQATIDLSQPITIEPGNGIVIGIESR